MPDALKAGIESLSGISVDDVHVHYNSSKPAQVEALAYTQGTEIYIGTGQEHHLAHEAWHVVQQKQGRVKPTVQAYGVTMNNAPSLESEADRMGAEAVHDATATFSSTVAGRTSGVQSNPIIQPKLGFELELAVLVDDNGRPIPEKESLGTVGPHLDLTVDQNSQVEAPTPTASTAVNYDLPVGWQRGVAYVPPPGGGVEVVAGFLYRQAEGIGVHARGHAGRGLILDGARQRRQQRALGVRLA